MVDLKQLIVLLFCILTSKTVNCHINYECNAQNVTEALLNNIRRDWQDFGTIFSIRVVFLTSEDLLLPNYYWDWTTFKTLEEPLQLMQYKSSEFQFVRVNRTKASFRSHFWAVIVFIPSRNLELGYDLSLNVLGHPVNDRFIFVSSSRDDLESYLTRTRALDNVRNKYAMYWVPSESQFEKFSFRYLVEPDIYTGNFSTSKVPSNFTNFNNLNGRVIKLIYLGFGLTFKKIDKHKYNGIYFDIFSDYSRKFNFSIDMYNENLRPGNLKNGVWSGLVGELQHGRADICAALGVSYERYPYIEYSTVTFRAPLSFILREPIAKVHWTALFSPLTPLVWLLTIGAILGLIVTFILLKYAHLSTKLRIHVNHLELVFDGVLVPYAIVMEQSANIFKRGAVLKLASILCIILNFVIGTAYKSNLVGFLTFPQKPIFPKSFHDLYAQKHYGMTLVSVGGMELEVFRTSQSPMMQDFSRRVNITYLNQTANCIDNAMKSKMVCICWRDVIQAEVLKLESPQLRRSIFMADDSESILYADISTAFKKGSIYQDGLNRHLGYTRDTGVIEKLLRKFWHEENQRQRNKLGNDTQNENESSTQDGDDGKPVPLKVENTVAVSYAYIFGILTSGLCFLSEIIFTTFHLCITSLLHI